MEVSEKLGSVESVLGQIGLSEWEAERVLDLVEYLLVESDAICSLREKEEVAFQNGDPEENAVRLFLEEAANTGYLIRTTTGREGVQKMMQRMAHTALRLDYVDIRPRELVLFAGSDRR